MRDAVGRLASVRANEVVLVFSRLFISITLVLIAGSSTAQLSSLQLLTTAIIHAEDITALHLGYATELPFKLVALFLVQE